ncbi:hypothetical protein [Yinghuangia seranimata]|uniref:hypothetical protein n=1 Tax=Yinghuangia seranimata TaxID=408067 RepID=UPI00248C2B9D|nr:hypothetical protein [Yinghuangia seranimata]MDI2126942.1 hypothetical protein [Yinghuangia seranimata]
MTETIYTLRAGAKMDRARIAAANAEASEKTAAASVVQAEMAARVAAIRRQQERDIRAETGRDKAEQRAARRARWSASLAMVRGRRDFTLVTGVMTASVGTAWPAQMGFYLAMGMHPVLAVLVTAMTEGAAWAGAAMASKAIEEQRPAGMYRAITWGSALFAATLNVVHTWAKSPALAAVLGMASLLGVLLWEAYAHSRTHTAGGKSGAQIRAEIYRKARFRKVARRTRDLIAAVPGMDEDAAWVIAWRSVHGADPGVTHRTLKQHHKAVAGIAELLDKAPVANPCAIGLNSLQTLSASLPDMAPGGTVADSQRAVRDAVVVAFDASYPIEELIGVPESADESAEQSGPEQRVSGESPQTLANASRPTGARRRPTGPVPPAAKSAAPKRTADELLADARRITAGWPIGHLTADRIRKSVRTSAESARTLRDTLRAERADSAAPEDSEGEAA